MVAVVVLVVTGLANVNLKNIRQNIQAVKNNSRPFTDQQNTELKGPKGSPIKNF